MIYGHGEAFALPSTLKTMGWGVLKVADCAAVVVPEGVTELMDYFLMNSSRVLCVFVPASATAFGSELFDYGGIRIYTPEGSAAARLEKDKAYEWVPCKRAEDMPIPVYAVEDGFEYGGLRGPLLLQPVLSHVYRDVSPGIRAGECREKECLTNFQGDCFDFSMYIFA